MKGPWFKVGTSLVKEVPRSSWFSFESCWILWTAWFSVISVMEGKALVTDEAIKGETLPRSTACPFWNEVELAGWLMTSKSECGPPLVMLLLRLPDDGEC